MDNNIRLKNGHVLPLVRTRLDMDIPLFSETQLEKPRDIVEFITPYMVSLPKEISVLICFDAGMSPICVSLLGEGGPDGTEIPARDVVQIGLLANASSVAVVHNHPSCYTHKRDLAASPNDVKITDVLIKACRLMGMDLVDSIVISSVRENGKIVPAYYSMREKKITRMLKLDIEKNSKGFGWLTRVEGMLEWDKTDKVSAYWGMDVEKIKSRPSVTAYSPEELKRIIRDVNEGTSDMLYAEQERE